MQYQYKDGLLKKKEFQFEYKRLMKNARKSSLKNRKRRKDIRKIRIEMEGNTNISLNSKEGWQYHKAHLTVSWIP